MSLRIQLKGDELALHGLDFNRFAKDVADELGITLDEAREHLAKALGAQSHHDLRDKAAVVKPKLGSALELLESQSLTPIGPFSPSLPDEFGPAWQVSAIALFDKAVTAQRALTADHPGRRQFIAIVGAKRSGKSSLARHLAHTRGGAVRDITLYPHLLAADLREGAVWVYDRPAELPPPSMLAPQDIHPEADFSPQADLDLTVRKLKRNARASFPFIANTSSGSGTPSRMPSKRMRFA